MTGYDLELQGGYQCSVDVLPTANSQIKKKLLRRSPSLSCTNLSVCLTILNVEDGTHLRSLLKVATCERHSCEFFSFFLSRLTLRKVNIS